MTWKIEFHKHAEKSFSELDNTIKKRIKKILDKLEITNDPRAQGRALSGDHQGLWRYRVGDYRIICDIKDKEIVILVLNIGHRGKVYK